MLATTINSWIELVRQALENAGIDADGLLRRAGIDPDHLDDPVARVPTSNATRMWHLAVEETGDPCFGLAVARLWHPTSFHALGFAWLASETFEEALRRLVRYSHVVSTAAQMELRDINGSCELGLDKDPLIAAYLDPAPAAVDAGLGSIITMCRMAMDESFRPESVLVRRERPSCHAHYEAFFGAPVSFAAESNALRFPGSLLAQRMPAGNIELAHVNEQVVSRYFAQLNREDVAMQVKAYLVDKLPSGDVREDAVAERLNMSLRSLQRRLQDQGTSYKDLLEQTRRELAEQYVRNTRMSINEITFLLGFTEPANFSRAFRRWHGVSPSAFREREGR
jgi:AraC-like DNA-binding protein